jgi:6-phosphogluconolactonase (cycloisomerase 2 family)
VNKLNSNTVSSFLIDSDTGALIPVPGSSFPTGQTPIGLIADPNGKFLYVGDHMQDAISAYSIDPQSGALTRISGPAVATTGCPGCHMNTRPLRLAIHPMNSFAYVTNMEGNSLSAFSLDNGALSRFQLQFQPANIRLESRSIQPAASCTWRTKWTTPFLPFLSI